MLVPVLTVGCTVPMGSAIPGVWVVSGVTCVSLIRRLGLVLPLFPVGSLFPCVNMVGEGCMGLGVRGKGLRVRGVEGWALAECGSGNGWSAGFFFWCPSTTTLIFSHLFSSLNPFRSSSRGFSIGVCIISSSVCQMVSFCSLGVGLVHWGHLVCSAYPWGWVGESACVTRYRLTHVPVRCRGGLVLPYRGILSIGESAGVYL